MIIFLDFDGVLNSNMFFHKRHKVEENGKPYRDYSESLLPFLNREWLNKQSESNQVKIKSFYKNMCYTNYKNLLKLLNRLDSPEVVLSTSWRHGLTLESWNILFNTLPNWKYKIIGITPTNPNIGQVNKINTGKVKDITIAEIMQSDWSRHKEIIQFMLSLSHKNKKISNDYIILDDDDIFEGDKILKENEKHFFRTRRWVGLTNRDIRKIIKYIGEENGIRR